MRQNSFTLMEMIAVICVTSFLVVMTINAMKTDPTSARISQLGSACQLASGKAAREMANVLVEFDGVNFKASYVNKSGNQVVFKEFVVSGKVEAKMTKGGNKITSYTVTPQGTVNGGGTEVIFTVRKVGATSAMSFSVNGFTSRIFYNKNATW